MLSSALRRDSAYEELSVADLASYSPKPAAGWMITVCVKNAAMRLDVVITETFPDDPPSIYIAGKGVDLFLKNPHVEETGKICTISESAAIDANFPVELFRYSVDAAIEILTNEIEQDFLDEFTSYWSRSQGTGKREFLVVDPPSAFGATATAAICGAKVLIGASYDSIRQWAEHSGDKLNDIGKPRICHVVSFGSPLLPKDFPGTINDLRTLLKANSADQADLLDRHLCESKRIPCPTVRATHPSWRRSSGNPDEGVRSIARSHAVGWLSIGACAAKASLCASNDKARKGLTGESKCAEGRPRMDSYAWWCRG